MTTQKELFDAVQHVGRATGDPDAWTRGLTPSDIALLGMVVAPESEIASALAKIRSNHPTLFDPRTGAPVVPASPGALVEEQRGVGVAAIKKAETDLAHQNSAVAQLDLLVIAAVLNAHSTTTEGGAELRRLQDEIENAVRVRTDLDTPAGARDFQRYLIGKLREIGAVVQNASLDDNSKAVLASAWTALYESSKRTEPAPAAAAPATPVSVPDELPAYGADLGPDPLLEQLLAQEPAPAASAPVAPAPSAPAAPAPQAGMPSLPTLGGPSGGIPAGIPGMPRAEGDSLVPQRTGGTGTDSLDDLLAEAESVLDEELPLEEEPDADGEPEEEPADAEPDEEPAAESTEIRLPDGDVITAPNPQLANVINSALTGTPIGEAFHRNGLSVPPPGTPVADPVDPADVDTGDVGMFTDRLAVALDRTRALHGGQVGPLASVSGPSFLGWMHPPVPDTASPGTDTPAPTRPATTPAS